MHIKNALLCATIAGAGLVAAVPFRHSKFHERSLASIEKRDCCKVICVTGWGCWTNNYMCTVCPTSAAPAPAPAATTPPAAAPAAAAPAAAAPAAAAPAAAAPAAAPAAALPAGTYSTAGFGAKTSDGSTDASTPWNAVANFGSPLNSNIIKIALNEVKNYKTTVVFETTNTSGPRTIVVWNKSGPSTPIFGQFPSNPAAQTFTITPGNPQAIAFDDDSSGAFCDWTDKKVNSYGAYDCGYGEFTFNPTSGMSAVDVSMIPSPSGDVACNLSMKDATGTVVSDCNTNVYHVGDELKNLAYNFAAGPASLTATFS